MKLLYMLVFVTNFQGTPFETTKYYQTACECYAVLGYLQETFDTKVGKCSSARISII